MARAKPVTKSEIATAAAALKLNLPVRRAERKGDSIVLHTRAGAVTYKAPAPAKAPQKMASSPAPGR